MGSTVSRAIVGVLLLGLGGSAFPVAAQSMAEAARKERERRARQAGTASAPAKVYTDADLPASDAPPVGKPTPSPSPSPSPAVTEAEREAQDRTEAADRKRLEAEWRVRFADARRRISEAEARGWHKVVRTVFVAGIPVQQWVDEFEETEELRQARRELADLEEEYRKTGLPPGWVRP
jgi:hypothetical protein